MRYSNRENHVMAGSVSCGTIPYMTIYNDIISPFFLCSFVIFVFEVV